MTTTFKKDDAQKPRFSLIPPPALTAIAEVLTAGAARYGDSNWVKAPNWSRYIDALERHWWAWLGGEDNDPDTGRPHLAHLGCCMLFLLTFQLCRIGEDDRIGRVIERAAAQSTHGELKRWQNYGSPDELDLQPIDISPGAQNGGRDEHRG